MKLIIGLFIITCMGGLVSCTEDESTLDLEASEGETNSYSGPGSFWTADITSSTFTMERAPTFGAAVDLTVSGTVTTIPAGYQGFTVVSASGSGAPVAGTTSYGFEIPGFFTLISPPSASSPDDLLPMLAQGPCPAADVGFNWITTGYGGSASLTTGADIVGNAMFDAATSTFENLAAHSLDGTDVFDPSTSTITGSCTDGFMQIDPDSDPSTPNIDMWLSQSGAAMVRKPDDTLIVAMPAESFSASDLAGKNFYGLVVDDSQPTGSKVKPIWADVSADGSQATASQWSDVLGNVKGDAAAQLTFSAFDSPQLGFVQVAVALDSNNDGTFDLTGGNMVCQFKGDLNGSGKDMLFCAGQTPTSGPMDMFNILLVAD